MIDVLVVDDESISRRMIAYTLSQAGYNVTAAGDGESAFAALQRHGHQLVVSDWDMPGMNGIDLCRAIRAADFPRYVYFIMLTSHNRPEDTIDGLSAGADDFIGKPFNPGELIMRANTGKRIIGLETRGMTIFALAKLAESRDPETGAHLERVRSYCRVLARRLQLKPRFRATLDAEYVRLIYDTSPLHDIGKVAIPDAILLKPGKLTPAEFGIMKTHTQRGAETLSAALAEFPHTPFLSMARDIAISHHEKYDGSGYPRGLAGEQIPLCGRIVALADVYDALTSKRVYKDAFDHERAKEIIVAQSGKHFDPHVVEAFLAEEAQFIQIRACHGEELNRAACESALPAIADVVGGKAPTMPCRPGDLAHGPLASAGLLGAAPEHDNLAAV
jgi:putative two-component system response regulator